MVKDSLDNLLINMELRPGMYFTKQSVHCLKSFLDGYFYGTDEVIHLHKFQKYITEQYKIPEVISWDKIIDMYSSNEKEAFDNFFTHWKEYKEAQPFS